jgi:hypothetical protein
VKRNAQMMIATVRQLRDINDVVNIGLYLGLAVAGLFGITKLFAVLGITGDVVLGFGRVVAMLASLPTIGLGLQVFRARRLPEWARDMLPTKPAYGRGTIVALLGLTTMILAVIVP